MLRKIGYILTGSLLLLCSATTMANAISMMETDVNYGNSKTLYFKLSQKDSTYEGVNSANYLNVSDGYSYINDVADEMEKRLDNWNINADVVKEGYDTLKVTVRATKNDSTEYSYIENYLSFSGGDITVSAGCSDQTTEDEAPSSTWYRNSNMFGDNKAYIEYVNNVPVVLVEVTQQGEDGTFGELVKYCQDNTEEPVEDEQGNSSGGKDCYIVLWSHKQDNDKYYKAADSSSDDYDPNMAKRLIFGEAASNAWYVDTDNENNNYTRFQIIPNSDAIKDGSYDSSKAGAAYKAALYYCSILNASSYDVDVTFDYSVDVAATVDSLLSAGDWHLNVAFGKTMITVIAATVLGIVVLAIFYHLGSLSIISNAFLAVEGGMLLFAYFNAQFGIGALVGFFLGALVTAFGGIYYHNKLKEELYKGRSLKKADSEASKKARWAYLDSSVVAIILGICIYGLIPGTIGKLGLSLVLTTAVGLILNVSLQRLESWMLANDEHSAKHLNQTYFVDTTKIPDAMKDEKQTFFGPYADKDFSKHNKPVWITAACLLAASIIGISIFSNTSLGAYNFSGTYDDTTSISAEYRVKSDDQGTKYLTTSTEFQEVVLDVVKLNDKALTDYVSGDITSESTSVFLVDTDSDDIVSYTIYHFNASLSSYFNETTSYTWNVKGSSFEGSLGEALEQAISAIPGYENDLVEIRANNVVYQAGTPTIGTIYLGLGVAAAAIFVYLWIRYRLSRALVASLLALGSSVIVAGIFVLTRIPVTPIVGAAMIATYLFGLLFAQIILGKEKESIKDSREKDKTSLAFRENNLKESVSRSVGDAIIFALLGVEVAIEFIAIAPSVDKPLFLGILIGATLTLAAIYLLLAPLSSKLAYYVEKAKDNVKASWKNRPKDNKKQAKKTNEPKEATFIGIND